MKVKESKPRNDLVGNKFGKLTVIEYLGGFRTKNGKSTEVRWRCLCECGNESITTTGRLKSGMTKSCGCLRVQMISKRNREKITHRMTGSSEWIAWSNIKARCYNVNHDAYSLYGGRGIKVCKRWLSSFENFIEDMGKKPGPKYSIDRINSNGDYKPSNCRWATAQEQIRNRYISIPDRCYKIINEMMVSRSITYGASYHHFKRAAKDFIEFEQQKEKI